MIINSNKFNFNFFLSNNVKVENLISGATQHGGATQFNNGIYSNIEGTQNITVNEINNKISVFIPDTMEVNSKIDNQLYIDHSMEYIKSLYDNEVTFYNTKGSWYSKDLHSVVIDNITILTITLDTVKENDIQNFVTLATWIKSNMMQEGVSISINESLAIV